ncbi:hypothetical protein [Aureimonas altamirensis]|uniref:hypothetical protein n=1 Tax=Aureimonas altamirensis TaxID=370622 RepID=UPI000AECCECD|nr:hypothetical protein [Aureimonas altamirensis]
MLNDLKDWAIEKGNQTQELTQATVQEVQTKNVMDWSGTVWIIIGVVVVIALMGLRRA